MYNFSISNLHLKFNKRWKHFFLYQKVIEILAQQSSGLGRLIE